MAHWLIVTHWMGMRQIPQELISLLHPPRGDNLDGSWLFGNSFEALAQQLAGLDKPVIHCENRAIDCVRQDRAFFHSKMIDFFEENSNIMYISIGNRLPSTGALQICLAWEVIWTDQSL